MLENPFRCRYFSAPPCAAVLPQPALPQSPGRCVTQIASGPGLWADAEYACPSSLLLLHVSKTFFCSHNS